MNASSLEELIGEALKVREAAHVPYSCFGVGAALEAVDGRVVLGCNVENASYGLTMCAERVAVAAAVSRGVLDWKRLVVAVEGPGPVAPCGACRQVLAEFCEELEIVLADSHGGRETVQLSELLPKRFGEEDLQSVPSSG